MTRIRMSWRTLELTAEGHANSAPKGEDLVCCAISTITTTLANYLLNMKGARAEAVMTDGACRIRAKPLPGWRWRTINAYKQAMMGLEQLADQYPEYVSIREGWTWRF